MLAGENMNAIRYTLGYVIMAIGGSLAAVAFFYVRCVLIAAPAIEADNTIVVFIGTAFMMSGILVAGSMY